MIGVYSITHKEVKDTKGRFACYVGSSTNIPLRWSRHVELLKSGNHHSYKLQRAWKKYGPLAFTFEILEHVDDEKKLIAREQHYIDTRYSCYNVARIADRPPAPPKIKMATGVALPSMKLAKKIEELNERRIAYLVRMRLQNERKKPK